MKMAQAINNKPKQILVIKILEFSLEIFGMYSVCSTLFSLTSGFDEPLFRRNSDAIVERKKKLIHFKNS